MALTSCFPSTPAGTVTAVTPFDGRFEKSARPKADAAVRVIPVERYPWLVLLSLGFLLGALWVGRVR